MLTTRTARSWRRRPLDPGSPLPLGRKPWTACRLADVTGLNAAFTRRLLQLAERAQNAPGASCQAPSASPRKSRAWRGPRQARRTRTGAQTSGLRRTAPRCPHVSSSSNWIAQTPETCSFCRIVGPLHLQPHSPRSAGSTTFEVYNKRILPDPQPLPRCQPLSLWVL